MELMTQFDFDELIYSVPPTMALDKAHAAYAAALARIAELEAVKNGAYSERDKLIAAFSKLFPASLERHKPEDDDWENDWRWVVIMDLPTGQVSWHIHDSELTLFDHLRRNIGRLWDGHSTDQKYYRLAKLDGENRWRIAELEAQLAAQREQIERLLSEAAHS